MGNESYISPKNASIEDAKHQSTGLEDGWWNDTAFYHIWVKSFCDYDGDGCGDFNGIKSKLDYIKNDLGCDGIWLSPIFECDYKSKSPSVNMHGYDVKDYYAVNNYFGTEDDLLSLIQACHDKNIRLCHNKWLIFDEK
ncbi:MAG: alpha-amylase family glycosyl hydrolase [Treponema porcinum]|nr:alpha-amylase family glycosyl hydrolase [Treponema porcinum]